MIYIIKTLVIMIFLYQQHAITTVSIHDGRIPVYFLIYLNLFLVFSKMDRYTEYNDDVDDLLGGDEDDLDEEPEPTQLLTVDEMTGTSSAYNQPAALLDMEGELSQCSGYVAFLDGSGSPTPYRWITDPALFCSGIQDDNKKLSFVADLVLCLLCF
jgi:hypothetical protein